jgi:predicted CXXCH cytochrome family protein
LFWSDGRRFRRGVITCATCHDVHRTGAGGRMLREGGLRASRELCLGCHVTEAVVVGSRHDLAQDQGSTCGPCHRVHDARAAASWPAARGGGDRAATDLADFCANCHRDGGLAASTVVAERFHPPAGVPGVGDAKRVGCGGCHDPHRWNPAEAGDRGAHEPGDARTSFLVRSAAGPADLCSGCHAEKSLVVGTPHDPGRFARGGELPPAVPDTRRPGVCAFCHAIHGAQPLAAVPRPENPAVRPSPGSDPCESCHAAGKLAARATVGERSHPIGVSPGQDIGPDLPLYGVAGRRQAGGRIACATCHDPHRYQPEGGGGGTTKAGSSFLRLGADGFAPLCFPCHAEKSTIVGTDHDLRVTAPAALNRAGGTAEETGVCGSCHAIHHAPPGLALWNRGFGEGWDERSRACTGCHAPGNGLGARVPPRADPHFVNFPGKGLVRRRFTVARLKAARPSSIGIFDENGERGDRGYLSCASCHEVHRWDSDASNSGPGMPLEGDVTNSFLRVRSAALDRTFCAECHGETLVEHYRTYHFPEGK